MLSANFDPTDKQYTNQLRAAQTLEPIFAKQPDHPGVAHYLIHSFDYPPIAAQGLDAARRYATIAPDARARPAHALAHLHARGLLEGLGRVQPPVGARGRATGRANSPHAYDYMVYAQLQLAQDKAAAEVLAHAGGVATKPDNLAARLRVRGDAGAARARARRLGRGGEAAAGCRRPTPTRGRSTPGRGGQRVRARRRRGA